MYLLRQAFVYMRLCGSAGTNALGLFVSRALNIFAFLLSLTVLQCSAIIIRHDVDESQYKKSFKALPELVQLAKSGTFGTLIHPQWFVTAAHASYCLTSGTKVKIGGALHEVADVYHHPLYEDEYDYDIAAIRLKEAVSGIPPMSLYTQQDEVNKIVWFAAAGQTGTGISGNINRPDDGTILRVGSNKIISVDKAAFRVRFDEPETATELEGLPGFGDSGGPAYIEHNGQRQLVGIISRSEGDEALVGLYGIIDVSVRISYLADWLLSLMNSAEEQKSEIATYIPPMSPDSRLIFP